MAVDDKKDKNGEGSFVYPDGTQSDYELHEQIMAGVDDTDLRIVSAKRMVNDIGADRANTLLMLGLPPDTDLS